MSFSKPGTRKRSRQRESQAWFEFVVVSCQLDSPVAVISRKSHTQLGVQRSNWAWTESLEGGGETRKPVGQRVSTLHSYPRQEGSFKMDPLNSIPRNSDPATVQ